MKTAIPSTSIKAPDAFLFIGAPGSGKTITAMEFPAPYFADCDGNLKGAEKYIRERLKLTTPFFYDPIALDDDGQSIKPEQRWLRLEIKLAEACKSPDVQTIVVDSLSHLSTYLCDRILSLQKRSEMQLQDWIPFVSAITKLFISVRHSGKRFILICHELTERNSKGDVTEYTPNVSSAKIRDALPGFFTDSYRFATKPGAAGAEYYIYPERTALSVGLKNTYAMPSEIKVPRNGNAFAELNKYLKIV